MGSQSWIFMGALVVGVAANSALTAAEMWKCTQADGSLLFSDGGGVGCQEMTVLPEVQSTRTPAVQRSSELHPAPERASPMVPVPAERKRSAHAFAPVSRTVPSLSYHDLSPSLREKGWSLPNKGDITLVQIDVVHLPDGTGPQLSADGHFMGEARATLGTAVLAAAKATHYDPRFLLVRLTMPVGSILHAGVRVDGPSAGVAWTVAITSALLGDALRSDVCLSGTMDASLRVGWVGGLEHKIEGCHVLPNFHEMLVPAGQNSFAIIDKGMARSICVSEVATLADAYEIATGQPLRSAP